MTAFGPTLLAKVLDLNDTQESSLGLVFHYADRPACRCWTSRTCARCITVPDLDEGKAELDGSAACSKATAGVILRELIGLEDRAATSSSASRSSRPPT